MTVHAVTDATFAAFTAQPGLVLVDFSAPWCAPCKRTDPIVEQLAKEMPDVRFGKLNTDTAQATAARMCVMSMPTFMVFRDGRKAGQVVGGVPKSTLVALLRDA